MIDVYIVVKYIDLVLVIKKSLSEELLNQDGVDEWMEYFIDEHQCPSSILDCEYVIDDKTYDKDPHGIFELIAWFKSKADLEEYIKTNYNG